MDDIIEGSSIKNFVSVDNGCLRIKNIPFFLKCSVDTYKIGRDEFYNHPVNVLTCISIMKTKLYGEFSIKFINISYDIVWRFKNENKRDDEYKLIMDQL